MFLKKAFPFFFAALILFYSAGFYLVFLVMQAEIKKEMKHGKNEGTVCVLSFKKEEIEHLRFKDNGKEIIHEGFMYDIIYKKESGEYISYYCYLDKKETHLFATLEQHISKHISDGPQNDSKGKEILKTFKKEFFPEKDPGLYTMEIVCFIDYVNCHGKSCQGYYSCFSPPPETLL